MSNLKEKYNLDIFKDDFVSWGCPNDFKSIAPELK